MTAEDSRRAMGPLRVLVVDDDELARETIVEALEGMGCEVASVPDAHEAVSVFLSGEFDLIALDHRMPGLSGMELHKILSQEFGAGKRTTGFVARKLPPVVVITGYAEDPEIVGEQFGESIVGVVEKPHINESLGRIVRELAVRTASLVL